MPIDKTYAKKVYDSLRDDVEGFDKDEATFYNLIETDKNYLKNVHLTLKDVYGNDFDKDEAMFESALGLKKKEPLVLGFESASEASRIGGLQKPETVSQSPLKSPSVSKQPTWTPQQQKSLVDKIKSGDLTAETPEEEGYLSRIGGRIVRGMNTLNQNLAKTPEFIYNIAAMPQNIIAENFDIPSLAVSAEKVKKDLGITNQVADYYSDKINQLAYLDEKYVGSNGSVTTLVKDGKYLDAAKLLGEQIAESLPTTAAIAASGGLGATPSAITLGGGAVFGAAKYDEIADREDLSESEKTSIALSTGLVEGLIENIGTANLGRVAKEIFTNSAADVAKAEIKNTFSTAYKEALKKYMPISGAISEGIEEAATQFAQNTIDIYSGVDPNKKITDGLMDALIVGTGSGAVISSPTLLSKNRNKEVVNKQAEVEQIDAELQNENISDNSKQTLVQARQQKMSEINDILDVDIQEQRNIPEESKREIEALSEEIDVISQDIERATTDATKQLLGAKLQEIEQRIDELSQPTNETQETEETPSSETVTDTIVSDGSATPTAVESQEGDIERRRQEELDNLFSETQASTDKQLNTPVQKLSKEEVSKNIETAKQQNKDLIEELENPEFLNDEKRNDEWDKKADELSDKLPQGVDFRITDGKVDFFDSQSYREKGFGKNIVQVSVGNLHNKTEKFEVGDNLQVQDGARAIPAIVTKVNEHGKILEAKQEDGRIIISRGNIITLAPINNRLKINAKYDAELAALEKQKSPEVVEPNVSLTNQRNNIESGENIGIEPTEKAVSETVSENQQPVVKSPVPVASIDKNIEYKDAPLSENQKSELSSLGVYPIKKEFLPKKVFRGIEKSEYIKNVEDAISSVVNFTNDIKDRLSIESKSGSKDNFGRNILGNWHGITMFTGQGHSVFGYGGGMIGMKFKNSKLIELISKHLLNRTSVDSDFIHEATPKAQLQAFKMYIEKTIKETKEEFKRVEKYKKEFDAKQGEIYTNNYLKDIDVRDLASRISINLNLEKVPQELIDSLDNFKNKSTEKTSNLFNKYYKDSNGKTYFEYYQYLVDRYNQSRLKDIEDSVKNVNDKMVGLDELKAEINKATPDDFIQTVSSSKKGFGIEMGVKKEYPVIITTADANKIAKQRSLTLDDLISNDSELKRLGIDGIMYESDTQAIAWLNTEDNLEIEKIYEFIGDKEVKESINDSIVFINESIKKGDITNEQAKQFVNKSDDKQIKKDDAIVNSIADKAKNARTDEERQEVINDINNQIFSIGVINIEPTVVEQTTTDVGGVTAPDVSEEDIVGVGGEVETFELVENEGKWKATTKTYKGRETGNWVFDLLDKKQQSEYEKIKDDADSYGTKEQAEASLKKLKDFELKNKEAFVKAKEQIDNFKQAEEKENKDKTDRQKLYDKTANQLSELSDSDFEKLINLIDKDVKSTLEQRFGDRIERKPLFSNRITEDYHKAKADGSNPELVKAVEQLLGKEQAPISKTETTEKLSEEGGVGKGGEVVEYEKKEANAKSKGDESMSDNYVSVLSENDFLNEHSERWFGKKTSELSEKQLAQAKQYTKDNFKGDGYYNEEMDDYVGSYEDALRSFWGKEQAPISKSKTTEKASEEGGLSGEVKPTPKKVKVLGKDVNMYNDYIPSKVEDVEIDAMYSFNADSKDGIPSLLHDIAYSNKREVNGVKSENWHASISGEELLKLYPKQQSLKETTNLSTESTQADNMSKKGEKTDTSKEAKNEVEILDTEKKIAQLEKEMRKAPIRPSKGVASKKQLRIQIRNYKEQLRELKGLPPKKKVTDSVLKRGLRAFSTQVDENNLEHKERVVIDAIGTLDANDVDIATSDGNAKLRTQGALLTKGGKSIDDIVTDYISEHELDDSIAPDLRDAIISFVSKGDAYKWMDNIKEREAQTDPDAMRDDEYYNYGYQTGEHLELTDQEISELEHTIGELTDLTQEDYEKLKQQFTDESNTDTDKGVDKTESTSNSSKKKERKEVAAVKIDEIAARAKEFLRNKNLPEGTKTAGFNQDNVIDILASTVKALVNSGIEVSEAIKQVREYFEQEYDTSGIKDYEIKQSIARDELTDYAKEQGFTSYRNAVFAVNKYVKPVGKEDVITKEDIDNAKDAKAEADKEDEAPKGQTLSGRSKSYEEKRVPVSEQYREAVNAKKVFYQAEGIQDFADAAIEYLADFGDSIQGLNNAYDDMVKVYNDNPYYRAYNSIAIELLSDRIFAEGEKANLNGDKELANQLFTKSDNLRVMAFNAARKAGQYNAALAIFSSSRNPDAFAMFVNKEINKEADKIRAIKQPKIDDGVKEFKSKVRKAQTEAASEAVKTTPRKQAVRTSKFSELKERGVKRQKEALSKLKKLGFLGSNGLNNEAIEAIGELIVAQLEIGVYKAANIIQRIKAMTNGNVTDEHIKETYDKYKIKYDGSEYSLTELSDLLNKQEQAELLQSDPEKYIEQQAKEKLSAGKGKQLTLSELLERDLAANETSEGISKNIQKEFGLSEKEANLIANKFYDKYKSLLKSKIEKALMSSLGIKNVKEIDRRESAGEIKPFDKTLGGKIVAEVLAGALDSSQTIEDAFSVKYGIPVMTPTIRDNIRQLSKRVNAATTILGQRTANRNLISYIQEQLPTSAGSVLKTAYYVSLLSGVSTAAVNTWGNINTLVNQAIGENFVQSIIEAFQGNKANLVSSVQGKAKLRSAITNMNRALVAFTDIMARGGGENKYYNLNQKAINEFDSERLILKKQDLKNLGLNRLAAALGKLYYTAPAIINRNLSASDEAFYSLNYNVEATREIRKKLYKETDLRGKALEDAVFQQVYGTKEIMLEAMVQAEKEMLNIGMTPNSNKKLAKRIAYELISRKLDKEVQNTAEKIAAENTYRGELRGAMGYIGTVVPQMALITPFVNTVVKIAEKHMNYIPVYGVARTLGFSLTDNLRAVKDINDYFERKGIEKTKRTGELRNKQIAQVILSHSLLGVFYALSQMSWTDDDDDKKEKPLLEVSGGYIGMPYAKQQQGRELMPEYTLRIKDFKINYKNNPLLAMICLPLAVKMDNDRMGLKTERPINSYSFALSMYLYDAVPIKNIQEFFTSLAKTTDKFSDVEPENMVKEVVKSFAMIPANLLAPNTYKQIFDYMNPQKYQTNDYKDGLWKAINMEKIGGLIPTYDMWGKPVKMYPGETFMPIQYILRDDKDDDVTQWAVSKNISLPSLNRKTLVLDLDSKTGYTKKEWDKKQVRDNAEFLTVEMQELAQKANFRVLTYSEWAEMDATIRNNVYQIISRNLDKVGDNDEMIEMLNVIDMPLNDMTSIKANKAVDILFELERQKYINDKFLTGLEDDNTN